MADMPDPQAGKAKRRQSLKPPARQATSKAKCTIHITIEASQRLDIHATMMGLDRSALVEKLINDHLRRWVVSDRGGSEISGEEAA